MVEEHVHGSNAAARIERMEQSGLITREQADRLRAGLSAGIANRTPPGEAYCRRRADLIPALVGTVTRYMRHETPDRDIYTAESRSMMREWLITPAQIDQVARMYAGCSREELRYNNSRDRAVIRYPIQQRSCAPWFLERNGEDWVLDANGFPIRSRRKE